MVLKQLPHLLCRVWSADVGLSIQPDEDERYIGRFSHSCTSWTLQHRIRAAKGETVTEANTIIWRSNSRLSNLIECAFIRKQLHNKEYLTGKNHLKQPSIVNFLLTLKPPGLKQIFVLNDSSLHSGMSFYHQISSKLYVATTIFCRIDVRTFAESLKQ